MGIIIDKEFQALIPPLGPEEKQQLEANLVADGCRDPLVVWGRQVVSPKDSSSEGVCKTDDCKYCYKEVPRSKWVMGDGRWECPNCDYGIACIETTAILIDGHNRFEICNRLGIGFETVEMEFESRAHVRLWMRANQRGRRNLSTAWRIELEFADKADLIEIGSKNMSAGGGDRKSEKYKSGLSDNDKPDIQPVNTQKEIAKAANTSTGMVGMADQIKKKAPEVWEKAKSGAISISTAYQEIRKKEKKAEREAAIAKMKSDIESGVIELPEGLFEVISVDPPWNYGRAYDPDGSRVANPYPEMTQDELLKLELPFAEDSVLFLWTTHAFLWDAKALSDKWGFTYKATIVWDKEKIGMGAWLRMQCEFCLVCVRGNPYWNNTTWRDVIKEPRREHSRKPDMFYELVENVTAGRRLEYFSREQRQGWEVFGNETSKF